MRSRTWILALGLGLLAGCDALDDLDTGAGINGPDTGRDAWRPAQPPVPEGCSLWEGAREGDSADVLLELVLCDGIELDTVTGELQISGDGEWSLRRVKGERVTGGLWLTDVEPVREGPTDGGRYCWVDDYHLDVPAQDWMEGTAFSVSCDEALQVVLERVEGA